MPETASNVIVEGSGIGELLKVILPPWPETLKVVGLSAERSVVTPVRRV
jgi:hypothetical protein